MFAKILGVFWIAMGLLWLIKPEVLRNKLRKKTTRKLKWAVYAFLLVFAAQLLGIALKAEWLIAKVVGVVGVVLVLKTGFSLTSKASGGLSAVMERIPVEGLRLWAGFFLATGLYLFFIK